MGASGHGHGQLDFGTLLAAMMEKMDRQVQEALQWARETREEETSWTRSAKDVRCLMFYQSWIVGKPCRLLVDTGVERMFARSDYVDATGLQIAEQQLYCVAGHCLLLKGPLQASISVENMEEKLPLFVTDTEEPHLFGMDYLMQCETSLYLGRQTLRMQEQRDAAELSVWEAKRERDELILIWKDVGQRQGTLRHHPSCGLLCGEP
ncbi:hypothetical protein E2C01_049038 [Portunus trituberculatus]|uniref:Uncharacterized protein n=1 Tax=Portunus trituberculatus TaxID=210409 RepID=A0A5B7GEY9_PORTR|nr:hypothetical protein [Portunus trituberculatus]